MTPAELDAAIDAAIAAAAIATEKLDADSERILRESKFDLYLSDTAIDAEKGEQT